MMMMTLKMMILIIQLFQVAWWGLEESWPSKDEMKIGQDKNTKRRDKKRCQTRDHWRIPLTLLSVLQPALRQVLKTEMICGILESMKEIYCLKFVADLQSMGHFFEPRHLCWDLYSAHRQLSVWPFEKVINSSVWPFLALTARVDAIDP